MNPMKPITQQRDTPVRPAAAQIAADPQIRYAIREVRQESTADSPNVMQ